MQEKSERLFFGREMGKVESVGAGGRGGGRKKGAGEFGRYRRDRNRASSMKKQRIHVGREGVEAKLCDP